MIAHSFCESVYAGPRSPWHIRRLTSRGQFLTGGIDVDSLCGRVKRGMGWDLAVEITEHHLTHACTSCVAAYRGEARAASPTPTPAAPPENER